MSLSRRVLSSSGPIPSSVRCSLRHVASTAEVQEVAHRVTWQSLGPPVVYLTPLSGALAPRNRRFSRKCLHEMSRAPMVPLRIQRPGPRVSPPRTARNIPAPVASRPRCALEQLTRLPAVLFARDGAQGTWASD